MFETPRRKIENQYVLKDSIRRYSLAEAACSANTLILGRSHHRHVIDRNLLTKAELEQGETL